MHRQDDAGAVVGEGFEVHVLRAVTRDLRVEQHRDGHGDRGVGEPVEVRRVVGAGGKQAARNVAGRQGVFHGAFARVHHRDAGTGEQRLGRVALALVLARMRPHQHLHGRPRQRRDGGDKPFDGAAVAGQVVQGLAEEPDQARIAGNTQRRAQPVT